MSIAFDTDDLPPRAPIAPRAALMLLYAGPLLAGIAGHALQCLAVILALQALHVVVMARGLGRRGALGVLPQLGAVILLAAGLYAVGRGLGGVSGLSVALSELVPVMLVILGLALHRQNMASAGTGP